MAQRRTQARTATTFQAHLVLIHGLFGFGRDHPLSSGSLDGCDIPLLPLNGRLDAATQSSELQALGVTGTHLRAPVSHVGGTGENAQ